MKKRRRGRRERRRRRRGRKKVYASIFACGYVYMSAVSQGGQKRVSGHQTLELQH